MVPLCICAFETTYPYPAVISSHPTHAGKQWIRVRVVTNIDHSAIDCLTLEGIKRYNKVELYMTGESAPINTFYRRKRRIISKGFTLVCPI